MSTFLVGDNNLTDTLGAFPGNGIGGLDGINLEA